MWKGSQAGVGQLNSQVPFMLVLFERFHPTGGNVCNAAIKGRQCLRVWGWPVFIRRMPEILQPNPSQLRLIVGQAVHKLVECLTGGHS